MFSAGAVVDILLPKPMSFFAMMIGPFATLTDRNVTMMQRVCFVRLVSRASVLPVLIALCMAVSIAPASAASENGSFGERLAAAASKQRWVPVIYNPAYVKLKYPGGDVPWYTGVCTDVIVRAYRELGIDLQVKVHRARVGSGDRNIDHRRVPVLRKFFRRYGTSLKPSDNPNAYRPGDIVTYYLPDGHYSKTHIAIISDVKTRSGRPMIIHNRGLGVQLEDWLFEAKITGHYRYRG